MRSTPIDESLQSFWHLSSKDILAKLFSNPDEGLTETEVRVRLKLYGHNVLKTKKSLGTFKLLLSQFNTPLMYLLIFAASLSLLLYDDIDALIIFGIIFISALLSFIQERSAVKAMEKLLEIVQIKAKVIRNKIKKEISIEEVFKTRLK